jgi:hypothetical protein
LLFEYLCRAISKLLDDLTHLRASFIFREPVNWKELQVPDYPEIVKRPMDLGFFSVFIYFI